MERTNKVGIAGIAAIAAVMMFGGCSSGDVDSGPDAKGDVEVTACRIDKFATVDVDSESEQIVQGPTAALQVTNSTDKAADYSIEVAFASKDGSKKFEDSPPVLIADLAPGKSQTATAQAFEEYTGEITCTVSAVKRSAA